MSLPPLYLIESFLAFADSPNIVEAAKRLNLSQPAISAHLMAFEKNFDRPVFQFEGRKKVLTTFGEALFGVLNQRLFGMDEEIRTLNSKFESEDQAQLIIGGRLEILSNVFLNIDFKGALIFKETSGEVATKMLLNRHLDIAITQDIQKAESLLARPFLKDQFQLVFPKNWSNEKNLTKKLVNDLTSRPFLSYHDTDSRMGHLCKHFGINSEIKPHRVFSNWPLLLEKVNQKHGWVLCPTRFEIPNNCNSILIPKNIISGSEFFIVYRQESRQISWFRNFIEKLTHF